MYWRWQYSGIALAGCFLAAIVLVKPIGVSTQFVIVDGVLASIFNPKLIVKDENSKTDFASGNAYLNKSGGKYAKAVAEPANYGLVFVLAMIAGGFTAARRQTTRNEQIPKYHHSRFGNTAALRYLFAFAGGFIVLIGARLAGGCTSGHMMSGMMQTAVSGYLFALAAFITAIPVALLLYRRGGNDS